MFGVVRWLGWVRGCGCGFDWWVLGGVLVRVGWGVCPVLVFLGVLGVGCSLRVGGVWWLLEGAWVSCVCWGC